MNNKKIIYINGMPGAGKLTMAKLLAEKTGAKVIDNHQINNLIFNIKQFDDVPSRVWDFTDKVKEELFSLLATLEQTEDYIFTGCITKNYSRTLEHVKKLSTSLKADFYIINLQCDNNEILNRIDTEERKANKKLTDKVLYHKIIQTALLYIPVEECSYTIDTTEQTADETFKDVLSILKL